jgi:predicted cobalt transporter CbtA
MNLGLGTLLMILAIILFVLAALSNTNWNDYVAWGLAAFAAGHVIGAVGLRIPGSRR